MTKIRIAAAIAAAGLAAPIPAVAWAGDGFLIGTWIVRCPAGHDDVVRDITRNHDCEKCRLKSVDGGSAMVACPSGHTSRVSAITAAHKCPICHSECRRN